MKNAESLLQRLAASGCSGSPGHPLLMGILNLTPDSFSDGSLYHRKGRLDPEAVLDQAERMVAEGAGILDLGAESTRPGAEAVPPEEEARRLLPCLSLLARRGPACWISIDTRRAALAEEALGEGACLINDVSAARDDAAMLPLMARSDCLAVLMHRQGADSKSMQQAPAYTNVVAEVSAFLEERATAFVAEGGEEGRLLLDPGIGFGKTLEHNLRLLAGLGQLAPGRRLLLGASRKRFIDALHPAPVTQRLGGSLAALQAGLAAGVSVIRVHDVQASAQYLRVARAIAGSPP